jgi:hypothetical protein
MDERESSALHLPAKWCELLQVGIDKEWIAEAQRGAPGDNRGSQHLALKVCHSREHIQAMTKKFRSVDMNARKDFSQLAACS